MTLLSQEKRGQWSNDKISPKLEVKDKIKRMAE